MSYTDDDTPDFEGLRAFLMDCCGTAFAAGAGPALIDLAYRARAGHKRALTQRGSGQNSIARRLRFSISEWL